MADRASHATAEGGPRCLRFEELDGDQVDLVGGKCASLGELTNAGVPVPPGFAVTTAFYREFMAANDLFDLVFDELAAVDHDDTDTATAASRAIREAIESAPYPDHLEAELDAAYESVREQCGADDPRLAVRSSATAEDLPDASFAGQQDTYLNVRGTEQMKQKVRECISSLFTTRAITYREENGYPHEDVEISVGVQELVVPKCSGVMFTLNPQNGDRSKAQIEGSWGLGEAVVAGEVNPDNFLVDKAVFEIVERNVATKDVKTEVVEGGVENVEVPEERRDESCLTDDEILKLTEYGKEIEQHYGQPQDIEWVIDAEREFPESIYIVQSRPETVWSQEERTTSLSSEGEDTLDYISNTLNKSW
ncbi:MAG: PEP/pyruvate-binding domain-containing protein [Halobacteriales archaeon]